MGIFSNRDQYYGYNIYSMKKYVDKKRIIFNIVVIILIIITMCMIIYYITDTKLRLESSKKFLEQIIEQKNEMTKLAKKETEKKVKIPQLTEQGKQNIKSIYKSDTKRAFLTFDDGPSTNTNDVLNILKENDIKATFFVLGKQVEIFPEITKRIYDEGHYIANHGYSHIYKNIYNTPEQVLVEYNQCNEIIAKTIEIPEYNSHLFRFPGGSIRWQICKNKRTSNTFIRTK